MQFIKNGPEIPAELIEAQEEGRVVFFCGAGISYPAGLPGFRDLVDKIYDALDDQPSDVAQTALDDNQYDTAIGLLERSHAGGRMGVRKALAKVLNPDFAKAKATQTHQALLTLSKNRSNQTRLVTTNFDSIFNEIIAKENLSTRTFAAPHLPVPKNRWDGLVYLHGVLTDALTDDDLNRLIISSGDFGLAYLTERWAARFVSELFRGYTVCFVGYSINDPILRYMMDALAADKLMGEDSPKTFAFADFSENKEEDVTKEWEAKNVIPILYKTFRHHYYLHETLHAWAANYRDGLNGKQAIVSKYCQIKPVNTTKQDNFVGRMLWALSDKTGLPAKHFAEFDPRPSLDWLEPFSRNDFGHKDLLRFGVQPNKIDDSNQAFGLLNRPSPYTLSTNMTLVQFTNNSSRGFDNVMKHMARWLARHLDDPELFLWVISRGGSLHPYFEEKLKQKLETEPPSHSLQVLWALLLSGRVKTVEMAYWDDSWADRLKVQGLTPTLRFELRSALAPVVKISRHYPWPDTKDEPKEGQDSVSNLIQSDIVLNTDDAHAVLKDFEKEEKWNDALPVLLPDATTLLCDALDLMRELGQANDRDDPSYYQQLSISTHEQNNDYNEWTALINLTRDAWLAAAHIDPKGAMLEIQRWLGIPYPVFRRLVFFAAAQRSDLVDEEQALTWLLSDDHYWLWNRMNRRETIRLIDSLSTRMSPLQNDRLQAAIVQGPAAAQFDEDMDKDRMQWLLLAKFKDFGGALKRDAESLFDRLESKYLDWQLAENERDEFVTWRSGGEKNRIVRQAPRNANEMEAWLERFPAGDNSPESDDWQEICAKKFRLAGEALNRLAQKDIWPVGRWRQALQIWSTDKFSARSWNCVGPTVHDIPELELKKIAQPIAWWLNVVSNTAPEGTSHFHGLIGKILDAYRSDEIEIDAKIINRAISHPVGLVTKATKNWWFTQGLEDNQGLHTDVKPLFDDVCRSKDAPGLQYGPIILAESLIALYRVDREWTKENLLPSFDWKQAPHMAPGMWMSFLQSPQLYWPVLDELKDDFFAVPRHFDKLDDKYRTQYLFLLTHCALEPGGSFSQKDFRDVIHTLSTDELAIVAKTLFRALRDAGERREEYFRNRIAPFFKKLWPKTQEKKTPDISREFSLLCAVAGDEFPNALEMLKDWLQPIEDNYLVVHLMNEVKLGSKYSVEVLDFLSRIIDENFLRLMKELKTLLQSIQSNNPDIAQDEKFKRLAQLLQQHGYEWP